LQPPGNNPAEGLKKGRSVGFFLKSVANFLKSDGALQNEKSPPVSQRAFT